jgi:hypothetical protein
MGESTAGGTYDLDDPFRKGDFVQITLAGVPDGGTYSEKVSMRMETSPCRISDRSGPKDSIRSS